MSKNPLPESIGSLLGKIFERTSLLAASTLPWSQQKENALIFSFSSSFPFLQMRLLLTTSLSVLAQPAGENLLRRKAFFCAAHSTLVFAQENSYK
jgi:hypothetical protein